MNTAAKISEENKESRVAVFHIRNILCGLDLPTS
jgi:hypothetical protein